VSARHQQVSALFQCLRLKQFADRPIRHRLRVAMNIPTMKAEVVDDVRGRELVRTRGFRRIDKQYGRPLGLFDQRQRGYSTQLRCDVRALRRR
jgi:hypothetical protein